jgi:phosphatidylserine/phosphatidylglycerophosphate/cardiolipin synthase-like enzyme
MGTVPPVPYFPDATPGTPTFVDDSEWHPVIDGRDYFTQLDAALRGLGPGDSVQVVGLQMWAGLDLCGRRPGDAGYEPLAPRLVALAAGGVQVRILLAGELIARWLPVPGLASFRANVNLARELRTARPGGATDGPAPLAGSVLVDWSGEWIGSNHQKLVVLQRGGVVTAFVAGIDLVDQRLDAFPHNSLRLRGRRWGWHDAAVRLRGPAAARVHEIAAQRWTEAASLPVRFTLGGRMNPATSDRPLEPPSTQPAVATPGTAVRVVRSVAADKVSSPLPWRRRTWDTLPPEGVQSIFATITTALAQAERYVYLEDQYLGEYAGGKLEYELYPHLRDAAERGVKVVLLGSGVRDPEDPGFYLQPINRRLNRDLRRKLVAASTPAARANIAVWRLEHCTVHSKIVLIDDVFACIGSANLFSRSMAGVDTEVSAAVSTTTTLVRDLRTRLWREHLRAADDADLHAALDDVDCALGLWRPTWLPAGVASDHWRRWSAASALRPVWPRSP